MTTRAHLASGDTFDIDEETEGYFTHMNDDPVVRWEYTGPTPPGTKRPPGVSAAERRAQLQAELDALRDEY